MKIKITITNYSNERMLIIKEPEAVNGFIETNDEIEVETNEQEDNIVIRIGKDDDGIIYVQIWDALNTKCVIYHEGKDMFKEYL